MMSVYPIYSMWYSAEEIKIWYLWKSGFKQPVYEYPPEKYSAEKILNILLTAKPEQICQHKPKMITRSATFVVDVCCLENQEDI